MSEAYDSGLPTDAVKPWFAEHGVPHFLNNYSAKDRGPALVLPLLMVLAAQLGAGTWFNVSVLQLLVVPPTVVVLALVSRRLFDGPLGLDPARPHGRWLLPLWLLVSLVVSYLFTVVVGYPFLRDESPWFLLGPWVDTAVLFTALLACAVLSRGQIWASEGERSGLRWWLLVVVVVVVTISALEEDGFFHPLVSLVDDQAMVSAPQTLPSLVAVLVILAMALHLARATPVESRSQYDAVFVPAVPLLVLTFGVDNALISYRFDGWAEAVVPVVLLPAVAVVSVLAVRRSRQPQTLGKAAELARQELSRPRLRVWLPLFLFGYPLMAWLFEITVDVFGWPATGLWAFAVTLGVNVVCLGVTWFIVGFGLDGIAEWAFREARRNLSGIGVAFLHGLPLLLVFSVFFALTAETWEIVIEGKLAATLGVLALLLGLMTTFFLITSIQDLRSLHQFESWPEVRAGALGELRGTREAADARVHRVVQSAMNGKQHPAKPSPVKLGRRGWLNALLVLAVYQVLVFVPVAIGAFGFFLLLGHVAVRKEMAAEWTWGDGQGGRGTELESHAFWAEPWTRVALVLAVFSVLYLIVTVLHAKDQRTLFLGVADAAIRQRFAVRLAYDQALKKEGERQPDHSLRRPVKGEPRVRDPAGR